MKKLSLLCASSALFLPSMAFAQSTGTVDFEAEETIVVTGTRTQDAGGVVTPDSPKARQVLTEDIIKRQTPGQTILDTINLVPGVSFQNNDPYGSSGGTLNIRGFGSDRISLTFDGVPLNDTGNYAIYSNQQLDPELIEQVNVNLGTTDVDSPTASAVGGTVNYRTRIPSENLGALVTASVGEWDFNRVFGMIETGEFTPFGTRAFVSASRARNDLPYNNYGQIKKQQYNARLYQPIGGSNDFVSLSGNYNQNRNNFGGSVRLDNTGAVPNGFPQDQGDRFYEIAPCNLDTPQAGVADVTNSCGTEFDRRYNPSNTGNVRGAARFSLTEDLVLTLDPSYQYVKANGGGTVIGNERPCLLGTNGRCGSAGTPFFGYVGGRPYVGTDLNGDGDLLDQVTLVAPSQTQTHRYGLISSLAYDINDDHRVRVAYTYDGGRHRQTGQVGFVGISGEPNDVFPINDPIFDANGNALQKRDRLSYATLHQVSSEYRGQFLDQALTVLLGVRAPFFTRELNQNCFTTSASGFVDCFGSEADNARFAAVNGAAVAPLSRTYKYDKLLPNLGFTYNFRNAGSVFASYAKGLSVPGTDPLYDSLFFANIDGAAQPVPETTDSFDLGARYRTGRLQAQLAGWLTRYENRLASAYDVELDEFIFRNLGKVDKWGFDGSIAYEPARDMLVYLFGSWKKSKIKDDLQLDVIGGQPVFAPTAGKQEAGSPNYILGARGQVALGALQLGAQAKYTGKRYIYDTNEPVQAIRNGALVELFPEATGSYTTVDLDGRLSLGGIGMQRSYIQVNVTNLFDEVYVGGFGGGLNQSATFCTSTGGCGAVPYRGIRSFGSAPFVQMGAPRTISASFVVGF